MDFNIENLAPETDVINFIIGNNDDSMITITIDRDESGDVNVLFVDNSTGFERRMVLGKPGYTEKL